MKGLKGREGMVLEGMGWDEWEWKDSREEGGNGGEAERSGRECNDCGREMSVRDGSGRDKGSIVDEIAMIVGGR